MGKEQDRTQTLRDIYDGKPTTPLALPEHGYGTPDGGNSPNQKMLNCATGDMQNVDPGWHQRACEFMRDAALAGHCAIGNAQPEPTSPTHGQLNKAAAAALLYAALKRKDDEQLQRMLDWWRIEYAANVACVAVVDGKEVVRTPGARAFKKDETGTKVVMLDNSLTTKVTLSLRGGWTKCPKVGKGGYDVAALYIDAALKLGKIKPADLTCGTYEPLTKRYGFNVIRAEKGDDFYAWYDRPIESVPTNEDEQPNPALDPVHGVGVVEGRLFWRVSPDEALATAERIQREGRVIA